ncbi:MAG: AAA family ATPase [Symploca sp. SIO1B1]|nr:AAA family ATPase [Symploca sp. SIO1B1]
MTADSLWQDIRESGQLLYWIYFKPFTLRQKLQEIHPDLKPNTNPFTLKAEFPGNPALKRYAGQVWCLIVVTPIITTIFIAPLISIFNDEGFNWLLNGLFLIGWILGLSLSTLNSKRLIRYAWWFILLVIAAIFFFNAGITPKLLAEYDNHELIGITRLLISLLFAFGVALGIALGVARGAVLGVAGGVALGVPVGVAVGVTGGVALGVTGGVAVGVALGVTGGVTGGVPVGVAVGITGSVAVGVALGVALGVMFDVALGVAFGVTYVLGVLRVYFWLPELMWVLILNLATPPTQAASVLRRLPPYFDQIIHLPLPFLDKFIINAYRNNPSAAQNTIDYLINFTNQQKIALRAMAGIAISTLSRCRYVTDITSTVDNLHWIPRNSQDLSPALLSLLDIAASIRAAYDGTTPYRKIELLEQPITELSQLQRDLATRELAKDAPLLGSITNQWLQILQDSRKTLEEEAANSPEIPNVYLAGNALLPNDAKERFKGRQDIFRAIEDISLSAQSPVFLLYGRRRSGKTSALNYLPQKVGSDLIPLFVDVQNIASFTSYENIVNSLVEQIKASAFSARNLRLPHANADAISQDPFAGLQQWMSLVEKKISNKRFLLCLDEFERFEEVIESTNSRTLLNFLRHVMQHRPQWILLLSGSHRLNELQPYWSDCLIGTRTLHLTYLNKSEARELIQQPVNNFRDIYEPDAVEEILELTNGQPYLIQLICSCIIDHLNRDIRQSQIFRKVTRQDVQDVVPTVFEQGEGYFVEFWQYLSERERIILRTLAQQGTVEAPDQLIINKLVQAEIIRQNQGNIEFQVPLIRSYIETLVE